MTSRRQFLGAAAAVAGLSSSTNSAAATRRDEEGEDFPDLGVNFVTEHYCEEGSLNVRSVKCDVSDWEAEFGLGWTPFHACVALDAVALRKLIREIQPSRQGRRKEKIESGNIELALGDAMEFTDAETVVYGYPDGTKMRVGLEMRHEYGVHSLSFTDAEAVTFRDKLQEALDE